MLDRDELKRLQQRILSYSECISLPTESDVISVVDKCLSVLESESKLYRPYAKNKLPGGLLDFTDCTLPVIIVPDLHARPFFLVNILKAPLPGSSVLEALNEGKVMVICVGDYVHTETMGASYLRWKKSFAEWKNGIVASKSMCEEMKEGLATLFIIMELKIAFPAFFHCLKGNHENILNAEGGGDHAFRKFAMEGQMVKDFMLSEYSEASLHILSCFEKALPLVAVFPTFGISHAEPLKSFSKVDIINYKEHPEVILGLTWTGNDEAQDGSVKKQFNELNKRLFKKEVLWFGGHRPVPEKYLLRQGGTFVQIHNPDRMNVVFIQPGKKIDLEEDIICVGGED